MLVKLNVVLTHLFFLFKSHAGNKKANYGRYLLANVEIRIYAGAKYNPSHYQ